MTTSSNPPASEAAPTDVSPARRTAFVALALTTVAVQFSIAIAEICLTVAIGAWLYTLVTERRLPQGPPWALPLALFAGWTLVSAAAAIAPTASLLASKQLVLLLLVPITYDVVDRRSALLLTTLILAAGACSAVVGIGQYAILHYDNLGQRPRSTLGLYMTFSGLMMLVLNLALARLLFMKDARTWGALVIPALGVVLALTFTRSAWVGWCAGAALLLLMRDFRLTAVLPVIAALFFALAPTQVVQRLYSIFDMHDPTNRDRLSMMRAGEHIVADHPLTGVGPNMMVRIYPQYREPDAGLERAPHLHNVPLQIAAERGLPGLALWMWFLSGVVMGAMRLFRHAPGEGLIRFVAAAALASVAGMLGAGMFEHNFGDSEFLMVFLVLITLPFAVARSRQQPAGRARDPVTT